MSICSVSFLSFLTACLHRKPRTFSVRLQTYVLYENSSFLKLFPVQFSHSVMSNSLRPYGLQHAGLPCPSATPGARSNSNVMPLSQWCHPTIPSSVVPFSSCLQSFSASGSFPISQFFASGGQSIGAWASVLPMNIPGWFPLGLTGWISLQPKGLSRDSQGTSPYCVHSHLVPWFSVRYLCSRCPPVRRT